MNKKELLKTPPSVLKRLARYELELDFLLEGKADSTLSCFEDRKKGYNLLFIEIFSLFSNKPFIIKKFFDLLFLKRIDINNARKIKKNYFLLVTKKDIENMITCIKIYKNIENKKFYLENRTNFGFVSESEFLKKLNYPSLTH